MAEKKQKYRPFIIYDSAARLFWSNDDGWGDPASATRIANLDELPTGAGLPNSVYLVEADSPIVASWADPDGDVPSSARPDPDFPQLTPEQHQRICGLAEAQTLVDAAGWEFHKSIVRDYIRRLTTAERLERIASDPPRQREILGFDPDTGRPWPGEPHEEKTEPREGETREQAAVSAGGVQGNAADPGAHA